MSVCTEVDDDLREKGFVWNDSRQFDLFPFSPWQCQAPPDRCRTCDSCRFTDPHCLFAQEIFHSVKPPLSVGFNFMHVPWVTCALAEIHHASTQFLF